VEVLQGLGFLQDPLNGFGSHHGFVVLDLGDSLFFQGLPPLENFYFSVLGVPLFNSLTVPGPAV
jgi:hypothetical protein